jgi:hypothetical protein
MTTSKYRKSKKELDNGHWIFPDQLSFDSAVGFVYVIKHKESNIMYIGKKYFRGSGHKNRGQQSNWRSYTSSSRVLNEMITNEGKDNFIFFAIEEYHTRGAISYAESYSQMLLEIPTNNHMFLNRNIEGVRWKCTEKITPRHKKRLKHIVSLDGSNS